MSTRDIEYQNECAKSVVFQWKNGGMSAEAAMARIEVALDRKLGE